MKVFVPSVILFLAILTWTGWNFLTDSSPVQPPRTSASSHFAQLSRPGTSVPVSSPKSFKAALDFSSPSSFSTFSSAGIGPLPAGTGNSAAIVNQQDLSTDSDRSQSAVADSVTLPLVWQNSSVASQWTNVQKTAAKELGNKFVEDVAAAENQDPADPDYRERWTAAQKKSDLDFKALFGRQAYMVHQLQNAGSPDQP